MRIAISAPIKKDFQKEAEALFPDCQLLWMEDLPEEEQLHAIRTADVVLTHNIVGDLTKEEQQLLGHPRMVQTTRTGVDHLSMAELPSDMKLYCMQCRRLGARHRRVDGGDDHRAEPLPERAAP